MLSPMHIPYCYYLLFTVKKFVVLRLHFHGYQLLQAFLVFTWKNSPKNFCGCKVIHENMKFFTTNNKQ